MASQGKYLTEATLFAPAANKWASDHNIMNPNGGLIVLRTGLNLSDLTNTVQARINLGLRIGADVQPYSERLTAYAAGSAPTPFSLAAMGKTNADEWRSFIGAGTVSSITVSGGSTGLVFTNGTVTESGTATLTGTLSPAYGGTGVTSLAALKIALALNNVNNTSDANKPISTATQAALDLKFDRPNGTADQYIRGDGTLGTLPSGGGGTVTSVTVSGGTTGLTFSGNPITSSGTTTLGGTLGLANGGTGVTTLAALRTLLSISNVDNTSDANKPISVLVQTALNAKADVSTVNTALDRRVRIPASMSAGTTLELPPPVPGKVIGWNQTGTALINTDGGSGTGTGTVYVTVDIFDSDGTSRVFTLTETPSSIDALSLTIGGVTQTPGIDYTLSGAVLTISSAPPLGQKIVGRYFSDLAVVGLNADRISTYPFDNDIIPDDANVQIALQALETAIAGLRTDMSRKVNGPVGLNDLTLPPPEAGKVIGWNPDLNGLINIEPGTGGGTGSAISYVDVFVGDGATASYTLSFNPGTLANLSVSVGGVDQAPTDAYTLVNDNVLTFGAPIPNGSKVIARFIRAVGVGVTQASLVTTTNFIGNIIPDNSTVQTALQALETAVGTGGGSAGGPATVITDIFKGDGITTSYTLSGNPQFQNNLFIDVGGISNVPVEDYIWDSIGNVVTFTSAPPEDEPVVIRYIQALTIDPDRVGLPRIDKFVANGIQTDFELTYEPTAFESIFVSIGGIIQIPLESYTLKEPKTIAFSEPVDDTATIVVQYGSSFTGYNTPTTSAYRNRFVGNGSVTDFYLSFSPGYIENLDVTIGGVYQDPQIDYKFITPNLIRFTEAPDDTLIVLVKASRVNTVGESTATVNHPIVDVFLGDGVQQNFTLRQNPGSIDNLEVSLGGLIQAPVKDYTWDGGTTLNLIEPATNGDSLIVRYGKPTSVIGKLIVTNSNVPTSSMAPGIAGTVTWDENYIYVCVSTDRWKRSALTSW